MYYLYINFSHRTGRHYVGSTNDLSRRLREHNAGKSLSTRAAIPWELAHTETYATRSEAIRREAAVKAHGIRRTLDELKLVRPA